MPYGKINKATARALYEQGEPIWFFPGNTKPWQQMNQGKLVNNNGADFDIVCLAFRIIIDICGFGKGIHFYRNKEV